MLLKKGQKSGIEQKINMPQTICAPITKGQKIGEISYILNNENLSTLNIIANEDIDKLSLSNTFEKLFFMWFKLLR